MLAFARRSTHEAWCSTHNIFVQYALRAALYNELTVGDTLIFHALGVKWDWSLPDVSRHSRKAVQSGFLSAKAYRAKDMLRAEWYVICKQTRVRISSRYLGSTTVSYWRKVSSVESIEIAGGRPPRLVPSLSLSPAPANRNDSFTRLGRVR